MEGTRAPSLPVPPVIAKSPSRADGRWLVGPRQRDISTQVRPPPPNQVHPSAALRSSTAARKGLEAQGLNFTDTRELLFITNV